MATYYNPKIVTNNLFLYLDAANAKSYPGSGYAWMDLSGQIKDSTLVNGPTYTSTNSGCFENCALRYEFIIYLFTN